MIQYSKPKILLIDLANDVAERLRAEGFNVSQGTLGTPYEALASNKRQQLRMNNSFPSDAGDQEIIIIDLQSRNGDEQPESRSIGFSAYPDDGIMNPRPLTARLSRKLFERIFQNGGIFIVFAAPPKELTYYDGRKEHRYSDWDFLKTLAPASEQITVEFDRGKEILVPKSISDQDSVARVLARYLDEAEFHCLLHRRGLPTGCLKPLAGNKYGQPVAVRISQGGCILIFPEINRQTEFLLELLKDVLPNEFSGFFPELTNKKWLQRKEYELPAVIKLTEDINQVRSEAELKIEDIESQICAERSRCAHLYDLITETGSRLVTAVETSLRDLGFVNVVNVDVETGERNEDIQIHDESPVLLVEVKGITNTPSDEDALTVAKYIAPRMREWNRTDLQGLSVVNHQRNLPPLQRDNDQLFRDLVLENARKQNIGLMTTWDLFRLVRSFVANGWKPEHIKPLFYKTGRIQPVPVHYQELGKVTNIWKNAGAMGIMVNAGSLKLGDRIAFELANEFVEENVESLQLEDINVGEVQAGKEAGILTELTGTVSKGTRVYRVNPTRTDPAPQEHCN